jgi:hypothetical protein
MTTSNLLGHVLMLCVGCDEMHEVQIRSEQTEHTLEFYGQCEKTNKKFHLDEYYFD